MPETNPFLPTSPDAAIVFGHTLTDVLALRAVDFAELPFAVRLDQLIEALPMMRTADLLALLLRGEDSAFEAFVGSADLPKRLEERCTFLVAVALCHCAAELDRRIPSRKMGELGRRAAASEEADQRAARER